MTRGAASDRADVVADPVILRGPRVSSELIAAHAARAKRLRDRAMQRALLAALRGGARLTRRALQGLRGRRDA